MDFARGLKATGLTAELDALPDVMSPGQKQSLFKDDNDLIPLATLEHLVSQEKP